MNEAGLCDPCTTAVQTTVRGAMLFSLGQVPGGTISPSAVAWAQEILPGMFMSKLKYGLVLALVVGVLGGGAGLAMLQEVPPPQTSAEPAKTAGPKPEEEPVNQQDDFLREFMKGAFSEATCHLQRARQAAGNLPVKVRGNTADSRSGQSPTECPSGSRRSLPR
jgi:hypothetical protein